MTDHHAFSGVDLSGLDPTRPAEAFDRRIGRIHFAASRILQRRSRGRDAFDLVARWRAPLMAAVLLLMLASAAVFRSVQVETGTDYLATGEVAEMSNDISSAAALMTGTDGSSIDVLLGGFSQ